MSRSFVPGATTVGLVFEDGVILASEKRVAYGFTVLSHSGKKVFKISDKIGMAAAGLFSDMQAVARLMTAELELLALDTNKAVTVRSAAKLLANILFGRRYYPYYTELLVGGVDASGAQLFILDPAGSLLQDNYACVGTGTQVAIGVFQTEYKEGLSGKEAKELAIRAVKAAIERDAASGDGIDLITLTKKGLEEEFIPVRSAA